MKLNIGIKDAARRRVCLALQDVLANEVALTQATRAAHWNVVGPQFGPLHAMFGEQYEALNDTVDEIAERIRALGEFPSSTIGEFAKARTLDDSAGRAPNAMKMIASLLTAHEAVIVQLREAIELADDAKDCGTEDFLVAVLTAHQKTAWMLRAHLQ